MKKKKIKKSNLNRINTGLFRDGFRIILVDFGRFESEVLYGSEIIDVEYEDVTNKRIR